ncbi:hypothetical protein MRX96_029320 [Rhipicephalus microplus]
MKSNGGAKKLAVAVNSGRDRGELDAVRSQYIRRVACRRPALGDRAQQQPRSSVRLGANAVRAAVLSTCSSNRGRLSPKRAALHVTRRPRPPPDARGRVLFHARTSSSGKGTRAWGLLFCPARRDGQEGGVFFAPSRRDVTTAPAGALGGPGDTANAQGDSIPGKEKRRWRLRRRHTGLSGSSGSLPRLRWPTYMRCESNALRETGTARHPYTERS